MKANDKFYKNIKTIFPFHGKREKSFLNNLKIQINEFYDENNDCSYLDLQNEFGTLIEILKSYYDSIDSDYLLNKMMNKTIINASIVCIIIILVLISLVYIITDYTNSIYFFNNLLFSYRNLNPIGKSTQRCALCCYKKKDKMNFVHRVINHL